jgi:hypothetical protein
VEPPDGSHDGEEDEKNDAVNLLWDWSSSSQIRAGGHRRRNRGGRAPHPCYGATTGRGAPSLRSPREEDSSTAPTSLRPWPWPHPPPELELHRLAAVSRPRRRRSATAAGRRSAARGGGGRDGVGSVGRGSRQVRG